MLHKAFVRIGAVIILVMAHQGLKTILCLPIFLQPPKLIVNTLFTLQRKLIFLSSYSCTDSVLNLLRLQTKKFFFFRWSNSSRRVLRKGKRPQLSFVTNSTGSSAHTSELSLSADREWTWVLLHTWTSPLLTPPRSLCLLAHTNPPTLKKAHIQYFSLSPCGPAELSHYFLCFCLRFGSPLFVFCSNILLGGGSLQIQALF